ncbi:MAG: SGNH/GDSL hydrolase family protein, partial [Acidobacteriaceae bacterium]|nr:SGNH/GDSL hydrolase family protein [Acidobacteriaceae bacterium]
MRSNPVPLLVFVLVLATSSSGQNSGTPPARWVGTWGASPSPQLPDPAQMKKAKLTFANETLREIVHVSVGGALIRVRLSNAYGKEAVEIGAAHIALRAQGAAIIPGSDQTLTFSGQSSITIPPNALVLSDPISLKVAPS